MTDDPTRAHAPDTPAPTQPPHSVEAEEAVLGSILIAPENLLTVHQLTPENFYIVRNGWVLEAMRALAERDEQIDYLTVIEELKTQGKLEEVGGPAYITYLINHTPATIYTETYAKVVQRAAQRRRLIKAASEIARAAHEESADIHTVLARCERAFLEASDPGAAAKDGSLSAVMLRINSEVEERKKKADQGIHTGIPTGLTDYDALTGGLQDDDLVITAGRPGMGKTSLLLNIALHAAREGQARVGIVSMEMSDKQIGQRLIAMDSAITTDQFRTGRVKDWGKFVTSVGTLGTLPVVIDDTPRHTPASLRARAWRWKRENGLDLLLVDYIDLMDADFPTKTDVQRVSDISRKLKQLARELGIPVVAACQLNRQLEHRQDKRPKPSDLRNSGTLEQDADIIVFVYRDVVYNPETADPRVAELIVAKHRNGPTDTVRVHWHGPTTTFTNLKIKAIDYTGVHTPTHVAHTSKDK